MASSLPVDAAASTQVAGQRRVSDADFASLVASLRLDPRVSELGTIDLGSFKKDASPVISSLTPSSVVAPQLSDDHDFQGAKLCSGR